MTTLRVSRKKQKAEYRDLLTLITRVIGEWDPYTLLESGAPRDEFAHEVALVAAQVSRIRSATKAALVIAEVFSTAFDPKSLSVEVCSAVGERLFAELKQNGFID